jgi:hypothetical protein
LKRLIRLVRKRRNEERGREWKKRKKEGRSNDETHKMTKVRKKREACFFRNTNLLHPLLKYQ